jgi:hypothetical protein
VKQRTWNGNGWKANIGGHLEPITLKSRTKIGPWACSTLLFDFE